MRRCRTEAKHAEGFRSVASELLRALGDFPYTLKAGPAGGRQHPTSTPPIIHGGAPQEQDLN
jgi:hypothetical protein